MESEIISYKSKQLPVSDYIAELKAFNQNIAEFSVTPTYISNVDSMTMDTTYLAYARFKRPARKSEIAELESWLMARTKADKIRLVTN